MKRHGADSHLKDKKYTTLVYVPHNGKTSRTLKLANPISKLVAFFMIFAVVITSLALVLNYFIRENKYLNEKNSYIIEKYQEQILASNTYISRQSDLLADRLNELNEVQIAQTSLSGGIMNLSVRLENLSTQYFSELPGTTTQVLDHSKIDEFIGEIREITHVLNEFEEMKEMSESQIVKFKSIRDNLSDYLEYVPSYWPTESTYIASPFGMRWHPIYNDLREHTGIDLGGAYGDDIYAAGAGEVVFSRYDSGYGYTVRIDHGDGLRTVYAHCSKLLVKEGETVEQGQLIAKIGSTGVSTGPHLHFEVRIDNVPVNPLPFISKEEVE